MARGKKIILKNIRIESAVAEGKCIAHHEDKVIFVEGVAPDDVVDVQLTRNRKKFTEGRPVQFHQYSNKRETPFCSHYGLCGGCKWQHIKYEEQLLLKEQQVADNLQRIAKVDLPPIASIISAPETTYYRNKLEFTFSDSRWLTSEEIESGEEINRDGVGFHIPKRYDKILHVNQCYLQPDPSNGIRKAIHDYARENHLVYFSLTKQKGFLRNLIIRMANTGQIMVIMQFGENNEEAIYHLLDHLVVKFPKITSLNYVINQKGNDTLHDLNVINHHGQSYIEEQMPRADTEKPLVFRIGPKSFFQTNSKQALTLYKIVDQFAQLTGKELVYDLYTGTGTIANFVAHKAKKVLGLEYVEEAVADATVNSEINDIKNTGFYAGDIRNLLSDTFINTHGKPDVIITDPPRAGMHEDVVKNINLVKPGRIVYVSCNPATQARDIGLLSSVYNVEKVQPIDMFPHTHHVENVVLLGLRK